MPYAAEGGSEQEGGSRFDRKVEARKQRLEARAQNDGS
jgi:hypothetical protein